jgi:hypothetical protein
MQEISKGRDAEILVCDKAISIYNTCRRLNLTIA